VLALAASQGVAEGEGAPVDGLALAQLAGHQLVLGLVQLGEGRRGVPQPLHLGQQGLLALGQVVAAGHHRADHEVSRLLRQVGVGEDLGGDLRVVDQGVVQPRRLAGGEDGVQHLERRGVGVGGLGAQPGDGQGRQRHIGPVAVIDPGALARRLHRAHPADRLGRVLQRAEILVDPGVELRLVQVAGHHQGGVVGAVVGGVEGAHVVEGGGVQLLDRADARPVIGVGGVGGLGHHQAEQPAVGVGQHPLTQLLLHHVALGLEVGLVHHEGAHPLGLHPDQALQVVGRHHLVVVGEVVVGGGVVEAAHVLGEAVDALRREVPGGLEHHVLEEMGEAGAALRIVLRPDAVPDLDGDVGGGPVGRDIDLEPVGQGAVGVDDGRHHGGGPRGQGRGGEAETGDDEGGADGVAKHGRIPGERRQTLSTGGPGGKLPDCHRLPSAPGAGRASPQSSRRAAA
jgi:hypothetical protein